MAPVIAHYFSLKAFAALWYFGVPLQLHFVNTCRPNADGALTADSKDTDVSRLTSSSLNSFWGHKLTAREAAIQDPNLNGNLVDVCFLILVDNHATNVPRITSTTIS